MSYFVQKHLGRSQQEAKGTKDKGDINNGKQFQAELALYSLQTLCKVAPEIWKPILSPITAVIEEQLFYSAVDSRHQFRQTFKYLFDKIKMKYNDLYLETQDIREKYSKFKRKMRVNKNLVKFYIESRQRRLLAKVLTELKQEVFIQKKFNKEESSTSKPVAPNLGVTVSKNTTKIVEQKITQMKCLMGFKYSQVLNKLEKTINLNDLLKLKIEEIENVKYHQQTHNNE